MTRSQMVIRTIAVLVLLLAASAGASHAQVPQLINYQGRLGVDDTPASGTYRITFAFYPVAQGGTAIWSEVHDVVVAEGIFSVLLGTFSPLAEVLQADQSELYLGVRVGEAAELTPRLRVGSTAFALRAGEAAAVADGSVTADALAPGAVTASKLVDGAVTASKLSADAAVTSLNGQRGDLLLEAGSNVSLARDGNRLTISAAGGSDGGGDITAVVAGEGLTGGATAGSATLELSDGGVTEAKLADGSVSEAKLADVAVTTAKLGPAAVTEAKLADAAVTAAKVAPSAVTEAKLANLSVSSGKLADGAVTAAKLSNNAVTETRLANNAVTASKLANNAVTEPKLAGNAVTEAKLADGAVTAAKLGAAAVTDAKLADAAVTEPKLADAAVTASKLADGAVTASKLSADAAVTSLNGQRGALALAAGTNVTIDETAGTLTISAAGGSGGGGDITAVAAGEGLTGGGTEGEVTLGLADGGVTEAKLADGSVTEAKLADASVSASKLTADAAVQNVNGLTGGVSLAAGDQIDITQSGNTITISLALSGSPSSRRWKTNIRPLEDALSMVRELRGVRYEWTKDGRADIGLIAEEVQAVVPEVVETDANGQDAVAVDYGRLVSLLIEAVKTQQQQLDAQQAALQDLAARVGQLEARAAGAQAGARNAEP